MKKLFSILIAATLLLSLCACGGKKEEEVVITDALELLGTVWSGYADSDAKRLVRLVNRELGKVT